MKVRLHLVAAPWPYQQLPSNAIGALQAYIARELGSRLDIRSHSAFLEIMYRHRGLLSPEFHEAAHKRGEDIYFYLYYRRFLRERLPVPQESLDQYVGGMRRTLVPGQAQYTWRGGPLRLEVNQDEIDGLERSTIDYIDERIVPELDPDALNVLGFTLNYQQVYSSLYIAKHLATVAPRSRQLLVFGGSEAFLPQNVTAMRRLGIEGYSVLGEGERKLQAMLEDLLEQPESSLRLKTRIPGVFAIDDDTVDLHRRNKDDFSSQEKDLTRLPMPDYTEYFETLRRLDGGVPMLERILKPRLPLEGSRGCFSHCDFCNLHSQWDGFRMQKPKEIVARAREAVAAYGISDFLFSDVVCDTWAEKYAEELIRSGGRHKAFMFMRVHHPEKFWTKLALAGVDFMILGIETVSEPLLAHMSKGAGVVQGIAAQKYLRELGISSHSNLISHHPKSTLADVEETRRVLGLLNHLAIFTVGRFYLGWGSPLHDAIAPEVRRNLGPMGIEALPEPLRPYFIGTGLNFPPEYELSRELWDAWDSVFNWYQQLMADAYKRKPKLTVSRAAGGVLRIVDTRERAETREYKLTGARARVLDLCHACAKPEHIERELGLSAEEVREHLAWLIENRLMIEIAGSYLTLALRPRRELIENLRRIDPSLAPFIEQADSANRRPRERVSRIPATQ